MCLLDDVGGGWQSTECWGTGCWGTGCWGNGCQLVHDYVGCLGTGC